MSTTDSGRWIFLLTLAVVMIVSASQAVSFINRPCCHDLKKEMIKHNECFEQKPRPGCRKHAYMVRDDKEKPEWHCVHPDALEPSEKINCPPLFSRPQARG